MPKKRKDTPIAPNDAQALDEVLNGFKDAWDYTANSWHERWKNNHALYNNQRVSRGYAGITDTFVPMAFSTVETLTSALFGTKPKFNYEPPSERSDQKTDILNSLLDYFWDKDQWSLKVISTGRSMLKLGSGVDYYYWEGDHPCMLNVPLRDFFIDPNAASLEDATFMGRRFLTTKQELESFEVVDPGTGEMKPKYRNLDQVNMGKSQGDNTDKQEKDMWYGSTLANPENDQLEVIEYWTADKVISVANRSTVIEDTDNYYKAKAKANGAEYPQGLMPFAAARDYTDESLFYAKGEIDFIAAQQELLNDITNQNIDSITFTLNQMYTLDPAFAHLIEEIENIPGAVYPVPANSLMPIQQRSIPPDAFNERMNIKNEIRETTASNEVVKGVGEQAGGAATATEINAQIAGAGQRINLKVTQIENEYFHRMARIVLDMIKLYVTEPMMVKILGKEGVRWEEFDPAEFQGDYEPRVQLDITIENRKREQAAEAKELLAAFMGDPEVNQQALKKLVLQRSFDLDPDEVDLLMSPPEMPIGGEVDPLTGMPIDPMMAGMPLDMPLEDQMLPSQPDIPTPTLEVPGGL